MKTKAKAKKSIESSAVSETSVLEKILERLNTLEQKIDSLSAGRRPEPRPALTPQAPRRESYSKPHPHPHRQHGSHNRGQQSHSQQNFNRGGNTAPVQQQYVQSRPQNQGRHERQLFQAVCADCGTGCEVPFKPTGERPTYCKACFSKRKSGGSSHASNTPRPSANPVSFPQRTVKVIPTGGRVTITDMTASATATLPAPSRSAKAKPARSSKKSK